MGKYIVACIYYEVHLISIYIFTAYKYQAITHTHTNKYKNLKLKNV